MALGADLVAKGYGFVLNQDRDRRAGLEQALLAEYRRLDDFLRAHAPAGPFLFEDFGWAEVVFTPFFQRFWFLEYYEDFRLPAEPGYDRVRTWIDACVVHPAARQASREEVVKLYYDYAQGAGNGELLPGRRHSSFAFDPPWQGRPWPPRDKYGHAATDAELGLAQVPGR